MNLLYLGLFFLVIALVAGFFGFYSVQHAAVGVAKILFFIFVVLFLLALFFGFRAE